MKKAWTMRTQITALMVILVLLQGIVFLLALSFTGVYNRLDDEAFRLFSSAINTRIQGSNNATKKLANNAINDTNSLAAAFNYISNRNPGQPYSSEPLYAHTVREGADRLANFMINNPVSGAFFIMDEPNEDGKHLGVYLRSRFQGESANNIGDIVYEIGPHNAIPKSMSISRSWQLMYTPKDKSAMDFFEKPLEAARKWKGQDLQYYGYWSSPLNMVGDEREEILYTLPLIDSKGVPFGVFGLEISTDLFSNYYLPNEDIPYDSSFFAIIPNREDKIDLDWFIPGGAKARAYLHTGETISLEKVENCGSSACAMYETNIEGIGDMYCAVNTLDIYSEDSPFSDQSWALIGMVPKRVLHQPSTNIAVTMQSIISLSTIVLVIVVSVLVFLKTRKIFGLSEYAGNLSPYQEIHFEPTGILEIDDLTAAVEMLNQRVLNASKTTSRILELTLLPIGGFELVNGTDQVILTEYVYNLLDIKPPRPVYKDEWEFIYARLIRKPIPEYGDIYWFETKNGESRWLRIVEKATETGTIGVILDVTKDVEEHRRLAHELDYDALTHLYNRIAFKRKTHMAIKEQPNKLGAMIFCDLDNLKYINDTFGHDVGDKLLVRAGEIFGSFSKRGGIVARISGDEFAIFLHGYDSKEQIRDVIFEHFSMKEQCTLLTPDGEEQRIRYSTGVAYFPEDSDNETDLLKLADFAMYEAKHSSKGSMYEFNKESYKSKAYLLENREAINRLIDEELIQFAFQPIVCMRTGEIYAYEALMRPMLDNFKSPLEILTVAAAQSKLEHLERLVIMKAIRYAHENKSLLGNKKIFMNSIPSEITPEDDMAAMEMEYSDVFENIVVEITEEESDSAKLEKKAEFIRRNGMHMAIDDFGTGYSNELRIITMAPDIVKIDIELISNIDEEPDKQVLVSNIVNFCHRKGIEVVAEGVERYAELEELSRIDVDYVQGYYIKRPKFDLEPISEEKKKEIRALYRRQQKKRMMNG